MNAVPPLLPRGCRTLGRLRARPAGAAPPWRRAVMVGAAIQQTVAAKWTGDSRCSACGEAAEDLWHRFCLCRAWAEMHAYARLRRCTPPTAGHARVFCAGGSVLDSLYLQMADRACAVVRYERGWRSDWHFVSGACAGRQVAPRAELSAVALVVGAAREQVLHVKSILPSNYQMSHDAICSFLSTGWPHGPGFPSFFS